MKKRKWKWHYAQNTAIKVGDMVQFTKESNKSIMIVYVKPIA